MYLAALRKKMVSNEKFRALACNFDLLNDEEKQKTIFNLKELTTDLIEILENINASDITDSQNWDFDQYQSTQLIFRQLLSSNYGD